MTAPSATAARVNPGALLAIASMSLVQLGAALSTGMFATIGPVATAWLRLAWAGVIFLVIARPRLRSLRRADLSAAAMLGVTSGALTVLFFAAIERIPLATAVAIEFLGPLAVGLFSSSGRGRNRWGALWPVLAFGGVLLVTQPWQGGADLLGFAYAAGAGTCWAVYILLTQRVGDNLGGLQGLAISMPVAALATLPFGLGATVAHLSPGLLLEGLFLALLLPVVPYALELLALRRLDAASFGTLMSLEPALALVIGAVVLSQLPQPVQIGGIALVTVAAIAVARSGPRE
ncbi:EamA family transporter [Longispora albida]|uniref:EamA family transporter n=1 Tax=Longispora albida TaxID=203523 RepID=UPI00047661D7|nr:EamA family transporter [Longispora albida]